MELSYMELRGQIYDICHKMWQLGWVVASDGNVSAGLDDRALFATPTGMSKSFIAPEKPVRIDGKDEVLEGPPGYRPSSEIEMHPRYYKERENVNSVLHAHPPAATGYAVANVSLGEYSMVETVIALGPALVTPYGAPSTYEVPDDVAPYLEGHDAALLRNRGALAVRVNVVTIYYHMETLELSAKISPNAGMLEGAQEVSRENINRLISMGKGYGVTGRHPGYKKYSKQGENRC